MANSYQLVCKFYDISGDSAEDKILYLANNGIVMGVDDESYMPNLPVSRAEFAALVNRACGYTDATDTYFNDVHNSDWFYNDVCIAANKGIIVGHEDNTFRPNDYITHEQAVKILVCSYKNEYSKGIGGIRGYDLYVANDPDFEGDTIEQRPASLFFRSYQPLNVSVQADPANKLNKMFTTIDAEQTHQYGNTFFDAQDDYVELYTSVMAKQTTGSFSIGLYKTGLYTTANGTTKGCAARVVFANDGKVYDGTKRNNALCDYKPNTWYDIKVACFLKEKYIDIYINDELLAEHVELDSADVESVNQFIFDTTDGTDSTDTDTGTFCLDNIIVRAPKALGKDSYLTDIKINGESIKGFAPQTYIYRTNMTMQELETANISFEAGATATVKQYNENGGIYFTVVSGDHKSVHTYCIKAK